MREVNHPTDDHFEDVAPRVIGFPLLAYVAPWRARGAGDEHVGLQTVGIGDWHDKDVAEGRSNMHMLRPRHLT